MEEDFNSSKDFIRQMIETDVSQGVNGGKVNTRFPPEPNGYLQIGHAKAICLNFEIAKEYGGSCNLRFDDTNPEKESDDFVEAIKEDINWLGYDWNNLCFASDYFDQLYLWAIDLINMGAAYIDESSPETISELRGTLKTPGKESAYRDRPSKESVDLLSRMKSGEFEDGKMVLRAKIDMNHPNMNMRDPILYRIKHINHHRLGNKWCIYPSYDFTHGQSDSLEGITHSLCSLEFEDHRPLYDWFIEKLKIFPSKQTEFARLNLSYTVVSKRKLRYLVENSLVDGWDDPRMPTLSGMRRRGYAPDSIKDFCKTIGVTKVPSTIDISLLEHSVREYWNQKSLRRMVVFDPLEIEIINWENDNIINLEADNNPEELNAGKRLLPFGKKIYIDRKDFKEQANRKFYRLKLDGEVRLRNAYIIKCKSVLKDSEGEIVKLLCEIDPGTLGKSPEDRKVKGVIQWVEKTNAVKIMVREIARLFTIEKPESEEGKEFYEFFNKESSKENFAYAEPSINDLNDGNTCQFERIGYYCRDERKEKAHGCMYFNQTVSLKGNNRF